MVTLTPDQFKEKYGRPAEVFNLGKKLTSQIEVDLLRNKGEPITRKVYGKEGEGIFTFYYALQLRIWLQQNGDGMKLCSSVEEIYIFEGPTEYAREYIKEKNSKN